MNMKTLAICLYVMFIYWLSLHYPILDTLFYPTLGAFSFLFISRSFSFTELSKITLGAFLSSIVGTLLFYIYPSVFSFFINAVITIWLINKFKWNAPPIAAIAFIPFFSHSSHVWAIPLSVCGSLLGLMLILLIAETTEKKFGNLFSFFIKKQDTA